MNILAEVYLLRDVDMCEMSVCRRSPVSVAAAAIFMASQASDDKKSQKGKDLLAYLFTGVVCKSDLILPIIDRWSLSWNVKCCNQLSKYSHVTCLC